MEGTNRSINTSKLRTSGTEKILEDMKIHSSKQGESEWFALRCGKITASEVDALISPEFSIRKGSGVKTYLCEKLAERVLNYSKEQIGTFYVDQGKILETIAIPWYQFAFDCKIDRVGFCESDDGKTGCSPDGLIGEDGGIEIKSPSAPVHLKYLLQGEVPKEYVMQLQMTLWVTGRKWWKFVSYSTHLPPLVLDVYPIPEAQDALSKALPSFIAELDAAYDKVKSMMKTGSRAD